MVVQELAAAAVAAAAPAVHAAPAAESKKEIVDKILAHDQHFIDHGFPYEYSHEPISYNPYGFPLSRTGIPIVQALNDPGTLGSHDVVGTTFWIATNAILAFTVFFLVELKDVPKNWRRSVCVLPWCAVLHSGTTTTCVMLGSTL